MCGRSMPGDTDADPCDGGTRSLDAQGTVPQWTKIQREGEWILFEERCVRRKTKAETRSRFTDAGPSSSMQAIRLCQVFPDSVTVGSVLKTGRSIPSLRPAVGAEWWRPNRS